MSKGNNSRLLKLFAASATAGGLVGVVPQARAALCSCMPTSINKTITQNAFQWLGSATAGWDVSVNNDDLYGFASTTAPTVYFDYYLNDGSDSGSGYFCNFSNTGSATCGTQFTDNGAYGYHHQLVSATGVYGGSNSPLLYYFAHLYSAGTVPLGPIGIAYNVAAACWS